MSSASDIAEQAKAAEREGAWDQAVVLWDRVAASLVKLEEQPTEDVFGEFAACVLRAASCRHMAGAGRRVEAIAQEMLGVDLTEDRKWTLSSAQLREVLLNAYSAGLERSQPSF